jgi:hypothetical protein
MISLIFSLVPIPTSAQESDDVCATVVVPAIQEAGLDSQISAPVFGCEQEDAGNWYMRKVASTRDENYIGTLDEQGTSLLRLVDAMSMDQAFLGAVQFDRSSSTLFSVGVGNVMNPSDISDQAVGSAPNWLNNYTDIYSQAMQNYLTRTAGQVPDLVEYMQWFMARRDVTLTSMSNGMNPMASTAFLANWGYQQFPWFWQLSDQLAIEEYVGSLASPTLSSDPTLTDGLFGLLEIEFVDRSGARVPGACVAVYEMVPGSEIMFVCDNNGRDLTPLKGVIQLYVAPGRYNITVNQAPEGFLPGAVNAWVVDVSTEGTKQVIMSE